MTAELAVVNLVSSSVTEHAMCHPFEMMYAAVCMIMGGVMERFPALKVAFLEANCSWVPYWLWRLDEHYEHRESTYNSG